MTIYRTAEEKLLKHITLSGMVLDLGGSENAPYRRLFQGDYSISTADIPGSGADIECDFEQPLPIKAGSYDVVLLINVLEHIFEYRQLLAECHRVLKPGGRIVVATPFIFPYHPSPNDYHRYTAAALTRALASAGFSDAVPVAIGSGVFAARWLLIERLLPESVRFLSVIAAPLSSISDALLAGLARLTGRAYDRADAALGFVTTAHKP